VCFIVVDLFIQDDCIRLGIIILIFQMGKLTYRDIEEIAEGHPSQLIVELE
jgi:hypothetical protein